MRKPWLFGLLLHLLLARCSVAILINRTIDDTFGDSVSGLLPNYSPQLGWNVGQNCTGCFAQPSPASAFQGSWHDGTHTPGDTEPRVVNMMFNGTAVYAYCILANTIPYTTTLTNVTFSLDGNIVGNFVHIPTNSSDFQYNVPVYANDTLPNGQHTFVIEATGDGNSSLILFDYITYTFDTDSIASPSSSASPSPSGSATPISASTSHLPVIVGAVVGVVALLAITAIVWFILRRRRQNGNSERTNARMGGDLGGGRYAGDEVQPFTAHIAESDRTISSGPSFNPVSLYSRTDTAYNSSGQVPMQVSRTHSQYPSQSQTDLTSQSLSPTGHQTPQTLTSSFTRSSNNPDLGFNANGARVASDTGIAASGAGNTSGSRTKRAMRQEELDRQVQQMETAMQRLQAQRNNSVSRPPPTSTAAPASSSGSSQDSQLLAEIDALKREVERLKNQQTHMMWEMNEMPPPSYAVQES